PSFSHNVELEYGYDDFLSISVYFSGNRGGFEQVTIIDEETNVQQYIPQNFITNNTFGLNHYPTVAPFKWLKTNFFADIYYSEATSSIPITIEFLKGWNGEFRITNDFVLNKSKTFLFNASYFIATTGVDNLDTNSSFSNLSTSLKLFLLDKKLQLSLYGNDLLKSSRTTYSGYSNGIRNTYSNYNDQRMLRFSVLYIFGGTLKDAT